MADVRDESAVRAVCAGARFVFHLAAIYRFWAKDPQVIYDVNVGRHAQRPWRGGCRGLRNGSRTPPPSA